MSQRAVNATMCYLHLTTGSSEGEREAEGGEDSIAAHTEDGRVPWLKQDDSDATSTRGS